MLIFSLNQIIASNKFVIVTASYNNKEWYKRNLDSLFNQKNDAWRLIYINDCSTDGTGECVKNYIAKKGLWHKVTLINNAQRKGHLANQYHAISTVDPTEIVVNLDGDDWFAHDDVLTILDSYYNDPEVWMTYGQFAFLSSGKPGYCKPIDCAYAQSKKIRSMSFFIFSHLRTFYAALFHKINLEDLMYEGSFFPKAADVATMYPMVEMAGTHVKFIPEVLYVYNNKNPLGFYWTAQHKELDKKIHTYLRALKPYQALESLM